MPAKSGASHAIAAFLSIVIGAVLSNFLSAHTGVLTGTSEAIGGVVANTTGTSPPRDLTGLLIISTVLAFGWGVAYHYARHGSGSADDSLESHAVRGQPSDESAGAGDSAPTTDESAGRDDRHSYRTLSEAREADEELRASLRRQFDEAVSRLDDIHDRLVDAGERDRAASVASVRDDLSRLEQTVARTSGDGVAGPSDTLPDSEGTNNIDETRRERLARTHASLLDTAANLLEVIREIHQSSTGSADEAFIIESEQLIQRLDSTLTGRQTAVETGETV